MKENYLFLDTETTTKNKGNPYTSGNKLCYIGFKTNDQSVQVYKPEQRAQITEQFHKANYLVGFNLKFDLAWLAKYGLPVLDYKIWDCQLAEFLLNNQTTPYPSLNNALEKYRLPLKDDRVATYWEAGIDTPDIPEEIITEYLTQDVEGTYQVFLQQWKQFKTKPELLKLFELQCEDLLVLLEMEMNGLPFNVDKAAELERDCSQQIADIETSLTDGYWGVPINWNSGDHLSAFLYGGTITYDDRVPIGTYKSGAKQGLPRYKIITHTFDLPKLVEPLPKTELKKEGYYQTDEPTLRSLKGDKKFRKIRDLIIERSKIEKLRGTYYQGYIKKITEMEWDKNIMHGQFNQVVARTGRLSSSAPNLQNIPPEAKQLIETRWK